MSPTDSSWLLYHRLADQVRGQQSRALLLGQELRAVGVRALRRMGRHGSTPAPAKTAPAARLVRAGADGIICDDLTRNVAGL